MMLYHGTNVDIDDIDLKKSRPDKDFGARLLLDPSQKAGGTDGSAPL